MKIFIGENHSCNLNYQSTIINSKLCDNFEIVDEVKEADIIVFSSSCACSESTIYETIQYIKDCLKEKKPESKVYLTGCITREFKDEKFNSALNEWFKKNIDYVIPHNRPYELINRIIRTHDIPDDDFGIAIHNQRENVAKLYISNGCLNSCAFCKLSYQYYPLKSVLFEEVKHFIDLINENGALELRIIGTNISQYGIDLYNNPMLPQIISYVEDKDNIQKLALVGFGYKDAIRFNFDDILSHSTKLDYISGSLETGSDRLLSLIRKGFTSSEFIKFIERINKKGNINLDLNIIAGLPTETIDDLKQTLEVLKQVSPYRVNICKYLNSSSLDLNELPQLPDEVIKQRARIYSKVLTKRNVFNEII